MKNILQKSFAMLLLVSSLTLAACGNENKTSEDKPSSSELTSISEQVETSDIPTSNPEPWWEDEQFRDKSKSKFVAVDSVTVNDNDSHTQLQKAYIEASWDQYFKYSQVNGGEELSKPRGVKISLDNMGDKFVELSLNKDFSNSFVYELEDANQPYVKNLLSNKTYYYRTASSVETFKGVGKSILTSNILPRNLDIDGVTNVRDLGGYTSKLGGTIKQNMIIRGARLNENETAEPVKLISEKGYKTLTQDIGVKTELDLRSGAKEAGHMNNDVFPEIEYVNIPMNTRNIDNIMLEFKPQIKEVFSLFANKDNYPVYVHCKIGTDRTGLVCYLMGALLGMDQESLLTDYLFSNFGKIGGQRQEYEVEDNYFAVLKDTYRKSTLQLCVEAFLLEIGVTQQEIDSIKNIMIEK